MAKVHIHWHDHPLLSLARWQTFCGSYSGKGVVVGVSSVDRDHRDQATCKTCLRRCNSRGHSQEGEVTDG